jgi:general stress protein YciG
MATKKSQGMTVEEAGRMGGQATSREHKNDDFYEKIGRKGGETRGNQTNPGNFANDKQKASKAGRKGGMS